MTPKVAKKVVSFCALLGSLALGAEAQAQSCSASKVTKAVDNLLRANGQIVLFEMRVVRPQTTRTLRMRFWMQTGTGGSQDRALARVEAPATERGVASLRLGNKMWSFVPSTGRVQQVPESMMLGSWMGSDWTNDDMVREASLTADYRSKSCKQVDHNGPAYRVELVAKKGRNVAWQKLVLTSRRGGDNDLMPLQQEYFSTRAKQLVLARTMTFSDFRVMGGKRIAARMVLQPAGRPGRRTEVRYISAQFNATIPDTIFSLQNLQKAR